MSLRAGRPVMTPNPHLSGNIGSARVNWNPERHWFDCGGVKGLAGKALSSVHRWTALDEGGVFPPSVWRYRPDMLRQMRSRWEARQSFRSGSQFPRVEMGTDVLR